MTLHPHSKKITGRTEATTVDKIFFYFKENPSFVVTPDMLVDKLDIPYNTAMGTLYRLWKEGLVERVNKGEYVYFEEEEDVYVSEIENEPMKLKQIDVNNDVLINIDTFKNSSENFTLRKFALEHLEKLSSIYRISNNKEVFEFINNVLNEDVNFHALIIQILKNIILFEIQNDKNNKSKNIIDKCYKIVNEMILFEEGDINARIVAWNIFVDHIGKIEDIIDIYFKIARSSDITWKNLGMAQWFVAIIRKYPLTVREYFLNNFNDFIREDKEEYAERVDQIHNQVLKYYSDFIPKSNSKQTTAQDW